MEIRRTLEEFIRTRSKTDEQFQTFVYEELALLKNEISKETQVIASSGRGRMVGMGGNCSCKASFQSLAHPWLLRGYFKVLIFSR